MCRTLANKKIFIVLNAYKTLNEYINQSGFVYRISRNFNVIVSRTCPPIFVRNFTQICQCYLNSE